MCGRQASSSSVFFSCRVMIGDIATWMWRLAIVRGIQRCYMLNWQIHTHMYMQLIAKPKDDLCSIDKRSWSRSPFQMVAFGTSLVIIEPLCICLFAFVRVLFNLVNVSFRCGDVCAEVWGAFCDYDYWMMNDEDEYRALVGSRNCEQWTCLGLAARIRWKEDFKSAKLFNTRPRP